ncbi:ankyrin repeat-containing domain protein [Phyllosticta capitalensis]|uniref:Ankyrin repeat-containing domain protein n=1 Tax=Phyllosticta capitalensis TaxID=121624 RepID=A0ABR1YJ13_9PEZI
MTVSFLLDKGVNINDCGEAYGTPLQEASWRGADNTAYVLINRGADVNLCGGIRGTALLAAATQGYLDLVKALLRAGADPNISSGPKGLTALQAATEREHWEVARLLLENGANEDKRMRCIDSPDLPGAIRHDHSQRCQASEEEAANKVAAEQQRDGRKAEVEGVLQGSLSRIRISALID